jgi:hypothetical protein
MTCTFGKISVLIVIENEIKIDSDFGIKRSFFNCLRSPIHWYGLVRNRLLIGTVETDPYLNVNKIISLLHFEYYYIYV